MDVFGFRIVVAGVPECYHALGVVHSVFKPLDGRFRDFIAIPKANGYQSLHTVLFGPYGSPIEVQIRTEEMDLIAERGIAAHWTYKHGGAQSSAQTRAHSWIANLLESQRATGSSLEFLENVKVDLFPDEVYLFTPKGDILSLPRNATALDFAYAVHTDVGNQAVAARVDRKLVPLRTKLVSAARRSRSSPPSPRIPGRSGWSSWSPARRAPRSGSSSSSSSTRTRSQLGHRMLDRALENMRHLAGAPAAGATRCVPRRIPLPAPGGVARRHRARQPHAGAGGAGAGATTYRTTALLDAARNSRATRS